MSTTMTPVGLVPNKLLAKVKSLAGFKLDSFGEFTLISDLIKCKRVNPSTERKSNEKNIIESDAWLPVRYNNFVFAQVITGSLEEAIRFTEEKLFKGGFPVFLPTILADKNPFLTEYLSYTKILNLCSNANKDTYSLGILSGYWNGGQGSYVDSSNKGLDF